MPAATPPPSCRTDHIQPYDHGGPTTITNLQRRCGPHNRAR